MVKTKKNWTAPKQFGPGKNSFGLLEGQGIILICLTSSALFLFPNASLNANHDTQRAKFAKKVHKPPLRVNVINFELNGFNASIWVPWSPSDPKKLHVCTYSNVRFTFGL